MDCCAACGKEFKLGDKGVQSNCGHFVHCFKVDCCEKDYCLKCNKEFHVNTNSLVVTMLNDENCIDEIKSEESNAEKMDSSRLKELKPNECDERHEFYLEKLEEQRKINLEIMKKVNILANNHQVLMNLVSEQTSNLKVIVKGFTQMSNDIDNVKEELEEVSDKLDDLLHDVFDDDNSES